MMGNGPGGPPGGGHVINPAQLKVAKCEECASTWRRAVTLLQCHFDRLDQRNQVQGTTTFFFCANCGRQLHFNGDVVDQAGPDAAPPEAFLEDWRPVKGDTL